MNAKQIVETAFKIITFSGNARSISMESMVLAREGKCKEARKMLENARMEINKAHVFQTNLIKAETNGEIDEITILLIHSQDHLMNGIIVLDMVEEFINLYELIKK